MGVLLLATESLSAFFLCGLKSNPSLISWRGLFAAWVLAGRADRKKSKPTTVFPVMDRWRLFLPLFLEVASRSLGLRSLQKVRPPYLAVMCVGRHLRIIVLSFLGVDFPIRLSRKKGAASPGEEKRLRLPTAHRGGLSS